jgi:hypothetical protein
MTSCISLNPVNLYSDKGGVSITQAKSSSRGQADTVKSNAAAEKNRNKANQIVSEGNTNNVGRQPADIRAKEDARNE